MASSSLHLSEVVEVPADQVYAYAADPRHLPEWAAGLSDSIVERDGSWFAASPMGEVVVEMCPPNDLGVLDHVVVLPTGERVLNHLRVLAWGDVSEVVFTLRRRAGTGDDEFARDAELVRADLRALRARLESGRSAAGDAGPEG